MNRFYRGLFTLTLLLGLLTGLAGPSLIRAVAAPVTIVSPGDVVISEFRFLGPAGGNDEFIELYNRTTVPIDIGGWQIWGSNNATPPGTSSRKTIPINTLLQSGQHYLLTNNAASGYSGTVIGDLTYSTGITPNGGIALTLADGTTIIDAVGLSSGSAYQEGTTLTPLSGSADQSYERKLGGVSDSCVDTNNNAADFTRITPSNPKNLSSTWSLCGAPVPATSTVTPSFTATLTGTPTNTDTPTLSPTATLSPTPITFTATVTPTMTRTPIAPHVVISEIAWAGTKASPYDEWIELYNPTSTGVDLTNWEIVAKDGLPLIPLSGTIPAGGFYLIYRGLANVISDVTADLVYPFDQLSDAGETLYLLDASRNTIDTANVSGTVWPAGKVGGNYPTMERIMANGLVIPDGPFAWITNTGVVKNGHDAAGHAIYGTPKQPNWAFTVTITPTATVTGTATRTPTRTVTPTGTIHTPTPTATPTLGIIINEVAWMGTAAASGDEWVELYNPTSADVNLSGWTLKSTDDTINIPLTGWIYKSSSTDPNKDAYYIIASSSTFTDVVIDQNMPSTLSTFENGGESLQLINSSGTLVDTANSKGGTWPAGTASPTYASMERHAGTTLDTVTNWYTFVGTPTKHDRNNDLIKGTPGYANWAASVTATPTKTPTLTPRAPTPRATNAPPLVAILVINEFLPRAGFDWNRDGKVDVFDEFIEVANLGPIDANLSGWKLDDMPNGGSNPYTLPSMVLKPGQRIVFYASQTNVLLSDGGDTVRLLNPNNVVKDAHSYTVVKVADQSTCRIPDIRGSWYSDCFPTPNQANSRTGTVPSAPMDTGLETPPCLLPDTLPEDFRLAECFGYGANLWNSAYWDDGDWLSDRSVRQNGSKWDMFVQ